MLRYGAFMMLEYSIRGHTAMMPFLPCAELLTACIVYLAIDNAELLSNNVRLYYNHMYPTMN